MATIPNDAYYFLLLLGPSWAMVVLLVGETALRAASL